MKLKASLFGFFRLNVDRILAVPGSHQLLACTCYLIASADFTLLVLVRGECSDSVASITRSPHYCGVKPSSHQDGSKEIFIKKDFFTTQELDFFCVTETLSYLVVYLFLMWKSVMLCFRIIYMSYLILFLCYAFAKLVLLFAFFFFYRHWFPV